MAIGAGQNPLHCGQCFDVALSRYAWLQLLVNGTFRGDKVRRDSHSENVSVDELPSSCRTRLVLSLGRLLAVGQHYSQVLCVQKGRPANFALTLTLSHPRWHCCPFPAPFQLKVVVLSTRRAAKWDNSALCSMDRVYLRVEVVRYRVSLVRQLASLAHRLSCRAGRH